MPISRSAVVGIVAALLALAPAGRSHSSVNRPLRVTIVGDSVAASIEEVPHALAALRAGLDVRLELRVCRRLIVRSCTYQGVTPPPALATVQALGRSLGSVLVVDVGYNDDATGYASGIAEIMRAARAQGAREVIWVTLRQAGGYSSTYRATDAIIARAERRFSGLRVADWNAYSAGKPWFADAVHPNAAGAVALVRFLRSYISASR
jgi:hypothetical protein